MTLVRFKNKPFSPNFNNAMDDFFAPFASIYRDDFSNGAYKPATPVNIFENETGYELQLVAPGFEKENFKISVDNNLLTIEGNAVPAEKKDKGLRTEFKLQSFKRSFTLDEKINSEGIEAKYVNGILTLNLPKLPEVKAATKNISIH